MLPHLAFDMVRPSNSGPPFIIVGTSPTGHSWWILREWKWGLGNAPTLPRLLTATPVLALSPLLFQLEPLTGSGLEPDFLESPPQSHLACKDDLPH